jgi:6-pyruvoyltetrahydropterin 2'-reductase|tara:strand:+ start:5430 stop:6170 length:741 start_codon:yes stop_codon:yes gene_type:complete
MSELFLSDDYVFYTIEGEGRYAGAPSVFMRLSMCNLTCQGFKSAASPFGCDSFVSWSIKNKLEFERIFQLLEEKGYIDKLFKGAILKITGGEPLIQQKKLLEFMQTFVKKYEFRPIIDFETNGTLMPDKDWSELYGATFTVSPKLSNNGDPEEKRYIPEVLRRHVELGSCFKFVVKTPEDVDEINTKYIKEPSIQVPRINTWLMPCCGSRQEQNDVAVVVAELCKEHGFMFSARLQLLIWDKALRV